MNLFRDARQSTANFSRW